MNNRYLSLHHVKLLWNMINSVKRASDILLLVAGNAGKPMTLSSIAAAAGLNTSTCAHIVKTLADCGLLTRLGRREGYILGDTAYYLTRDRSFDERLTDIILPEMERFVAEHNENIVAVRLSGGARRLICSLTADNDIQIGSRVLDGNLCSTPTGRLSIAHASPAELESYIALHGLPDVPDWHFDSLDELRESLAALRETEELVLHNRPGIWHAARPVLSRGRFFFALGVYLPELRFPGGHGERVIAGFRETHARIREKLM